MKTLSLSLILLFVPLFSQADTMTCTIKEIVNTQLKDSSVVTYEAAPDAPHSIQPFDVEFATGFVAISQGYTVVQIQTKADQRAFSFHGMRHPGETVGGLTCLSDASTCISVDCQ